MTLISLDNEQLTLVDIYKYNRFSCILFLKHYLSFKILSFYFLFFFHSFIFFLFS